jgi:hypothetical protein
MGVENPLFPRLSVKEAVVEALEEPYGEKVSRASFQVTDAALFPLIKVLMQMAGRVTSWRKTVV